MTVPSPEPQTASTGAGVRAEIVARVEHLEVRYGATAAVHGIDLEVRRGEVVGLIGPDGAGKTSTLRVLAGLQHAAAGTVEVLGVAAWKHRRSLHHRVGYLAQRFALYGDLSVAENVRFFALLYSVRDWQARRDALLHRVGLAEFADRLADRLSGGMRQKLALVCALMHSPELLLLDEPTTGVDPVTRREFWRLLAELVAEGLTLLVATPYLDEAERCSRVVLMHHGRVVADAAPATIPAQLVGTIIEVEAEPRLQAVQALRGLPGVLDVQTFASRLHVRLAGERGAVERIRAALTAAELSVVEMREIRPTLEDAFLFLTSSHEEHNGEAA
jgi:ABC-2 type transport system ATP-binding protein